MAALAIRAKIGKDAAVPESSSIVMARVVTKSTTGQPRDSARGKTRTSVQDIMVANAQRSGGKMSEALPNREGSSAHKMMYEADRNGAKKPNASVACPPLTLGFGRVLPGACSVNLN